MSSAAPTVSFSDMQAPPRRVLITGLHGFTGQYLQQALEQRGWQVWGLGANPGPAAALRYLQVDLNDRAALAHAIEQAKPHAVVHLAAIAFVGHGDADDFYRTNLLGTRHLLAVLAASWLVAVPLSGLFSRLADTGGGRALAEIGRGGLWAFVACVLLSIFGDAMDIAAPSGVWNWPIRLAIDIWVIVALWAMSAVWMQRRDLFPQLYR